MKKEQKEIRKVLSKLSDEELCEIHSTLNGWRWDERIGEIPKDFYNLPNYMRKKEGISKDTYITPFMREINKMVPRKDILRYHHLNNLGSTEEEFERWWIKEGDKFNYKFQSPLIRYLEKGISILVSVSAILVVLIELAYVLLILFR